MSLLSLRSRRVVVTLAAAVSTVAAAGALALLPQAQAVAPREHGLRWIGLQESSTRPERPRLGQSWVVYRHVYEAKGDRPVRWIGDSSSWCSAVHVAAEEFIAQCQRAIRTKDGSLVMGGMGDRRVGLDQGVTAILGGTGIYRGASGEATITRQGDFAVYEIHLDR